MPESKKRVAIVGTGMAGEVAAYLISRDRNAPLTVCKVYESRSAPGLHVNSTSIDGCAVDVPLRAISHHYYANLCSLYRHLGVELQPVDYSSTTSEWLSEGSAAGDRGSSATAPTTFSYHNVLIGGHALPLPRLVDLLCWSRLLRVWRIVTDLLFLVLTGPFVILQLRRHQSPRATSFGEYLRRHNFSSVMVQEFLYPLLSTLLSCSYSQVDQYPAEYILEFFCSRSTTLLTGWLRVREGVESVSAKLLGGLAPGVVALDSPVKEVRTNKKTGEVEVVEYDGTVASYDVVILATEPAAAKKIWVDRTEAEDRLLNAVREYDSELTVHSDTSLLPQHMADWRGMNIFHSPSCSPCASMTSARLSCYHDTLRSSPSSESKSTKKRRAVSPHSTTKDHLSKSSTEYIETWNCFRPPAKGSVLHHVRLTRAVWDCDAKQVFDKELATVQGRRGVFLVGAYVEPGVTLLEQAVTSSCRVAQQLGVAVPFPVRPCYEQRTPVAAAAALLYAIYCCLSFLRALVRKML